MMARIDDDPGYSRVHGRDAAFAWRAICRLAALLVGYRVRRTVLILGLATSACMPGPTQDESRLTVTDVAPSRGLAGSTTILISGTGFTAPATVAVGDRAGVIAVWSSTLIGKTRSIGPGLIGSDCSRLGNRVPTPSTVGGCTSQVNLQALFSSAHRQSRGSTNFDICLTMATSMWREVLP